MPLGAFAEYEASITANKSKASEKDLIPGEFTIELNFIGCTFCNHFSSSESRLTVEPNPVFEAPQTSTTINYKVGGTATPDDDYQILTGSITIPAHQTKAIIPVRPVDDTKIENPEDVIVTLQAGTGYTVGSPSSATVMIEDNDIPADLEITKTDNPDPVNAGSDITYELTVTNNGPETATSVTVNETLPKEVMLESVIASQGSCSLDDGFVCRLGTLEPKKRATVTIIATVDANTVVDNIVNTARVRDTLGTVDPNLDNNRVTEPTTVVPIADLGIFKEASPNPVNAGDNITYVLTVTNNGPGTATGVTVEDTLPDQVSLVSVSASQGGCSELPCVLGTLTVGANATVTIEGAVAADASGLLENRAWVFGNEGDSIQQNNFAEVVTAVGEERQGADLAITKRANRNSVMPGENITYTLEVTNNGPDTATGGDGKRHLATSIDRSVGERRLHGVSL